MSEVQPSVEMESGGIQTPDYSAAEYHSTIVFDIDPILASQPIAGTIPAPPPTPPITKPPVPLTPAEASKLLVSLWTGADGKVDGAKAGNLSADDVSAALKAGADPNSLDSDGFSVLIVAAVVKRTEVAKVAVAAGANVNYKNPTIGVGTALIQASLVGAVDIVKILLGKHADVNATTTDGVTALAAAQSPTDGKSPDDTKAIVAALTAAGEKK